MPSIGWPIRIAIALAGGLAMLGAFPPVDSGLLAVVGVALATLACFGARPGIAALAGGAAGAAFFVPLLSWAQIIGPDAWALLAGLCVAWWALLGAGTSLLGRLRLWPVWVASWWVLVETLRGSVPLGGFPWGRLAFAQADTLVGRLAAWIGLPGVSLAVALAGTCAAATALALARRSPRGAAPWALATALLLLVPVGLPVGGLPTGTTVSIAAVQGGTPQIGMGAFDVRRAVLDNHVRATLGLAADVAAGRAPRPDVVLWPESASDIDPLGDPDAAGAIDAAAAAVAVPIVLGTRITDPRDASRDLNVALAWEPGSGPTDRYAKTQLVPFGEYVPFRDILAPLIGRLDRVGRDLAPGEAPGHLDVAGVPLGALICFEVAYDGVVAAVMDDPGSAQSIAVFTNNATYALTEQPEQQLQITRMRAIETGRTVVVAATTGISAVIGPDGTVLEALGELETGFVQSQVPLTAAAPASSWLGPIVQIAAGLTAIGALGAALAGRVRGARRTATAPS